MLNDKFVNTEVLLKYVIMKVYKMRMCLTYLSVYIIDIWRSFNFESCRLVIGLYVIPTCWQYKHASRHLSLVVVVGHIFIIALCLF